MAPRLLYHHQWIHAVSVDVAALNVTNAWIIDMMYLLPKLRCLALGFIIIQGQAETADGKRHDQPSAAGSCWGDALSDMSCPHAIILRSGGKLEGTCFFRRLHHGQLTAGACSKCFPGSGLLCGELGTHVDR